MKKITLYSYELTITPPASDFNAKNLRPLPSKVFIRYASSQADAVEQFRTIHFPTLRRNGIVRGIKQALAGLSIKRMSSHTVTV